MKIDTIIWKERFIYKIEQKHNVAINEVEEVLFDKPFFSKLEKGKVKGEDLYTAQGQTLSGRYLIILFIHKKPSSALPISARDMMVRERKNYGKQKN